MSVLAIVPRVMRHLVWLARRSPEWQHMTYRQYSILRVIVDERSPTQSVVARRLLVSAPAITRVVSDLVRRELVERSSDPTDGRATRLSITVSGEATAAAMHEALLAAARDLLRALEPKQRMCIMKALDGLHHALLTHNAGPPTRPGARHRPPRVTARRGTRRAAGGGSGRE